MHELTLGAVMNRIIEAVSVDPDLLNEPLQVEGEHVVTGIERTAGDNVRLRLLVEDEAP